MDRSLEDLAIMIDAVEADLVSLQSRLWSVRQALQRRVGKRIGYQYEEPNERGCKDHAVGRAG